MFQKFDVVVVCQLFYPELVSTGQTLTELVEEIAKRGLKIKVVASQPTVLSKSEKVDSKISYKGIFIKRTWSTRFSKLSFFGKFINLTTFFLTALLEVLIYDKGTQLLLLTNPPYLPLLGWVSKIFSGNKYGVVLFDIMPEQAILLGFLKKNGILDKLWRFNNKLWYRDASYVIVLSKDMLKGAIENASLNNVKHEAEAISKTKIIHVWSDDRIIIPKIKDESSETKRLNLENKFVIQYSGNHGRFHDIETILEIAKVFRDEEGIIFQFIGEGYKKKLVNEFIMNEGVKNIYSDTYAPKEKLSDSLAMCDVGIVAQLPGQERVCFPSKLLGILAAGRPVLAICPLDSELAEIVKKNQIGFAINNGEVEKGIVSIRRMVQEKIELTNFGVNAYNLLKNNYTLGMATDKYIKEIKSLI